MYELYPTLIELFGTISAISVAYLVLLYEQAQRRIKSSKQLLVFEINSALRCHRTKDNTGLKEGHELRDKLLDNCHHETISVSNTEELIKILGDKVSELRSKGIENVEAAVAGERAKIAAHIEKYHEQDIARALAEFRKAETFYKKFPTKSSLAVGVPLTLCGYFILVSFFTGNNEMLRNHTVLDIIGIIGAIGGLCFVFFSTTSTLNQLKGPDKPERSDNKAL